MKLVMVGTGYVGLVSGACFAEFGFETVCVDKDQNRIENIKKGRCPFFEPGMADLLIKHSQKTKLKLQMQVIISLFYSFFLQ